MAIPKSTQHTSKVKTDTKYCGRHIETLFPKDVIPSSVYGDHFFLPASLVTEIRTSSDEKKGVARCEK